MSNTLKALIASDRPLPVFVSSSSNVAQTTTPIVVTAPTGIKDGDLIVAIIRGKNRGNNVTPPTGFTNQFVLNDLYASSHFTYTKTAVSESGNYTWTFSDTGSSAGVIMIVYRNATRINTVGTVPTETNIATSITPTYPGVLLASFTTDENALAITSGPSGMTQKVYASNASEQPTMALYELSRQNAVATGTKTITWTGGGGQLLSQLFQITNEPDVTPEFINLSTTVAGFETASLVINKPTNTSNGDLMIAIMCGAVDIANSWTGDTSWTEVADLGNTPNLRVAWKVASSEGSSYTFTAGLSTIWPAGTILTYRGAAYDSISGFDYTSPHGISPLSCSTSQCKVLMALAYVGASTTITSDLFATSRVVNTTPAPSFIIKEMNSHAKGPIGEPYFTGISNIYGDAIIISIKPTRTPA